ncbi:MAG: Dna2/Cas4 domain-containing protein [Chloroflexi bacterium]|nr:Dna2/Cas4 domain-containing protein [Chloroflexota bacterium]
MSHGSWALLALGLAALLLALLLWWRAREGRTASGLPAGEIVSSDMGDWVTAKPLFSARYRLAGKPDYLVETKEGLVPVEVKPGRRAPEPYDADVLQLAAYCLLVEEASGRRPSHGLLRYADRTFRIPYDLALEAALHDTLDAMRTDARCADVPRSHADASRCRFCGLRADCGQSLLD